MLRFALACSLVICTAAFADEKAELKAIAGTWVPEKFDVDGSDFMDTLKGLILTVDGEKYTVKIGDKDHDAGTLKLDGSKTPKEMDITSTEGSNKGKKFVCIYEVKDGKLKVCYSMDDKNRPTKFESAKGSNTMLAVYKKKDK